MLLRADPPLHLTYCTNIHPAEGWAATLEVLRRVAPALKSRFSPDSPFGIGLRLGAREARELVEGDALRAFQDFLQAEGLYVAIVNGFPYGPFHGEPVKTSVYAPDWRTLERVSYTLDLAAILAALIPAGVQGGMSTVPLSYKRWMPAGDPADWERITANVVAVAERLARIHEETGRCLHLDIEPEPDCVLETTHEAVEFFERWLQRIGVPRLSEHLGIGTGRAADLLREHVQVCFDCCHCAVEFENPAAALARLRQAGIRIGRVQLSSALTVSLPPDARARARIDERLGAFDEPTYLHQVVERCGHELTRFADLGEVLAQSGDRAGCERRIHFHVPLFTAEYEGLGSSQDVVRAVLEHARRLPMTQHLEIETYTWSVLPDALRMEVGASIAREYEWVLGEWRATS